MIEPNKNYCNDCGSLSITEKGQMIYKTKQDHICKLINKRILHSEHHPLLVRPKECPLDIE